MQRHPQVNFKDRTFVYVAEAILEQKKRGKWNFDLAPLISVNILNFRIDKRKKTDKNISYVKLIDTDTNEVFYKKLSFVYLELPRFKKKVHELQTNRDIWMFVLKNLRKLNNLPDEISNEIFKKLFQMAEIAALSEEDRKKYYQSLKDYNNMYTIVDEKNDTIAKKNKTIIAKNKTISGLKQENVTYKQQVEASLHREAAYQQQVAAKDKIIEDLMQRLALSGAQSN